MRCGALLIAFREMFHVKLTARHRDDVASVSLGKPIGCYRSGPVALPGRG